MGEVVSAKEGRVSAINAIRTRQRAIESMSDSEFKEATRILERKNPNASDAARYLEEEAMTDNQLQNFYALASRSITDSNLNQMTRNMSRKWAQLALDELKYRRGRK